MSTARALDQLKSVEEKSDNVLARLRKLTTELVADALDELKIEEKVIRNISPLKNSTKICGRAYTVLFHSMDSPMPSIVKQNRDYLDDVPKNKDAVVMIEASSANDCSVWGGLVNLYAKKHGMVGTIVNGRVRDLDAIEQSGYPIFHKGTVCNRSAGRAKVVEVQKPLRMMGVNDNPSCGVVVNPGDYILADRTGVVVVDSKIIEKVVAIAEANQQKEEVFAMLIEEGHGITKIADMMKKDEASKSVAADMQSSQAQTIAQDAATTGLRM